MTRKERAVVSTSLCPICSLKQNPVDFFFDDEISDNGMNVQLMAARNDRHSIERLLTIVTSSQSLGEASLEGKWIQIISDGWLGLTAPISVIWRSERS